MDLGNRVNLHRRKWRDYSDEEIESKVRFLVESGGDKESIVGYFIMDEPHVLDFPNLGKAVAAVKKYAPGKLAYINLFPNYATLWAEGQTDSQLGTKTYDEYLERYVTEVKPDFISYDNYQIQYSMDQKDTERALSYYTNLLAVRRIALKYDIPYWIIVSSHQIRNHTTIPSIPNLCLQVYTALAAGFKGITWYQYNQGGYSYSPISKEGDRTLSWFYLREVNRQILSIGPLIRELTSTGVYFTSPFLNYDFPTLPGQIIESVHCDAPLMVGEFINKKGDKYAMLVNVNLDRSIRFTFSTRTGIETPSLVVPSANDKEPYVALLKKRDMNNHKNDYWLTAGEGILIKFE
jgi:hypothetical protein